jgi:hypothetical protein
MVRGCRLGFSGFACILVLFSPVLRSQTSGKKKVSNQSDLPRFTYAMTGSASLPFGKRSEVVDVNVLYHQISERIDGRKSDADVNRNRRSGSQRCLPST